MAPNIRDLEIIGAVHVLIIGLYVFINQYQKRNQIAPKMSKGNLFVTLYILIIFNAPLTLMFTKQVYAVCTCPSYTAKIISYDKDDVPTAEFELADGTIVQGKLEGASNSDHSSVTNKSLKIRYDKKTKRIRNDDFVSFVMVCFFLYFTLMALFVVIYLQIKRNAFHSLLEFIR